MRRLIAFITRQKRIFDYTKNYAKTHSISGRGLLEAGFAAERLTRDELDVIAKIRRARVRGRRLLLSNAHS
jgi:hypothetical protein